MHPGQLNSAVCTDDHPSGAAIGATWIASVREPARAGVQFGARPYPQKRLAVVESTEASQIFLCACTKAAVSIGSFAGKRHRKSRSDVGPGTVVPSFGMVAQVLHNHG